MFVDERKHPGSGEATRRRWLRVAGLALVAAGAVATAPGAAGAAPGHATPGYATVFTHSAESGQLKDGRLTLRGVSGRVTWATNAGRSGVVSVRTLHQLIVPGKPATGTLHAAGDRGGDELAFGLSRPRYNRARRTVSYRAEPLDNHGLPSQRARAAAASGQFGAASLSIVPDPSLTGGAGGGSSCLATVENDANDTFTVTSSSLGDDQTWTDLGYPSPDPNGRFIGGMMGTQVTSWETEGNAPGDGCSNTVTLGDPGNRTITITTSETWGGSISGTCDVSQAPGLTCTDRSFGYPQKSWSIGGS